MSDEQRDVFISYQWNIKDKVKKLHDFLQSKNYTVYRDEHAFIPLSGLGSQISRAIKNADVFICCITEAYNNSDSCVSEISLATEVYKKPIIVLMFEKVDLTRLDRVNFYIARLLRINLYDEPSVMQTWSGPKCDDMIRALNKALRIQDKEKDEIACEENYLLGVVSNCMQLKVIDIDKRQCVRTLELSRNITRAKCLTKRLFVTICDDVYVHVWDLFTGNCIFAVQAHQWSVNDVEIVGDNTLITGGCDNKIRFWLIREKKLIFYVSYSKSLIGPLLGVHCLQVIDENTLASGGCRGGLKIWNLKTFTCAYKLYGHEKTVNQLALVDTHVLVSSGTDKTIRVWCLKTRMCFRLWYINESLIGIMIPVNLDTIAVGRKDGKISFFDVYKGEIVKIFTDDEAPVSYLKLIESNKLACVKYMNCSIWDLERNKKIKIF